MMGWRSEHSGIIKNANPDLLSFWSGKNPSGEKAVFSLYEPVLAYADPPHTSYGTPSLMRKIRGAGVFLHGHSCNHPNLLHSPPVRDPV